MDVKLSQFLEALHGFGYLARLDMGNLRAQLPDERLVDGLQNGRAQKFEYTTELCWKAIKSFLRATEGIDEASPKKIIKAYYPAGYTSEDDCLQLLDAIEDRSRLSHVYDEKAFNQILEKLPAYADLFERVGATLSRETGWFHCESRLPNAYRDVTHPTPRETPWRRLTKVTLT